MAQTPSLPPQAPPKAPAPQAPKPAAPQPAPAAASIYEAVLAASASFGPLTKDATNSYLKANYMSLPGLLKAVREPLSDQGVMITSAYVQVGNQFIVRTRLVHIPSGTELSSDFPVVDMGLQKIGACGTYAMRYSLLHLLGIAPADDDGATVGGPSPAQFVGPDPHGQERAMPQYMPQGGPSPDSWL